MLTNTSNHQEVIRGLNTGWLEAGPSQAPILVFLHGFPDTAASWEHQIEEFSSKFKVIALNVRGAGGSETADDLDRYAPNAVALDALSILRRVDPHDKQKIICIGHDLGAVHAWHLAALLQDRAAGVVIINGLTILQMLYRWRDPRQLLRSWYMGLMQLPLIPELLVKVAPARLRAFAYAQGGLNTDSRHGASTSNIDDRAAMIGPLNQYRAFFRSIPTLISRHRQRLNCPVLVIFGEDDPLLTTPSFDELSADARNLTIRIIPGKHWLHRDEPKRINSLLGRFFADSLEASTC